VCTSVFRVDAVPVRWIRMKGHVMTKPMQVTLIVYLVLLALMCVWVPTELSRGDYLVDGGHEFLWDTGTYSISVSKLVLQILAVTALGGGAMFVLWMRSRAVIGLGDGADDDTGDDTGESE